MFCSSALAIGMHLVSYHTEVDKNYNNVNPGIYLRSDKHQVGIYKNSIRNMSAYYAYNIPLTEDCRYEAVIGLATGYKSVIAPIAAIAVNISLNEAARNSRVRFLVGPTLSGATPKGLVFHAIIEKKF